MNAQQPISTMDNITAQRTVIDALRLLNIKKVCMESIGNGIFVIPTDTLTVEIKTENNAVYFISIEVEGMKYGMKGNFTPENIRKFVTFFAQ